MILNDYSQTIGAEVNQASSMIPSNPALFRAWTWKSKSPEFLYVTQSQGNEQVTRKFHFFLFAGKLTQVKETSDKLHYRLSDDTCKAITEQRAKDAPPQVNKPQLSK